MKNLSASFFRISLFAVLLLFCFKGFTQESFVGGEVTFPIENDFGGCPEVPGFNLVSTTATSATFSWTQAAGDIEGYSVDIFAPGADPLVDPIIASGKLFTGTMGTVFSLEPNTSYDAYILTVCNPIGTVSEYVGPISFATMTLGIEDKVLSGIVLYPNPVKDQLTLQYDLPILMVEIYSVTGEKVLKKILDTNTTILDVSVFAKGVYFIKLQILNHYLTQKFIKQ